MVKPEKGDGQKAQEKNVLMLYKHGSENGSRVIWLYIWLCLESFIFNILIKKQEELGEKQKEERLERGELQIMEGENRRITSRSRTPRSKWVESVDSPFSFSPPPPPLSPPAPASPARSAVWGIERTVGYGTRPCIHTLM